jgi:MoxR-like ATPase
MQPPTSSLRGSFQQLVVNHQVQNPGANRCYGRNTPRRQQPQVSTWNPHPPAPHPNWALNAVRADQATETVDATTIKLISDISAQVDKLHEATLQKNASDASASYFQSPDSFLGRKVRASITDLQSGLLERETEVRLLILAALCGEHLLLLGPPGTAKSELSRRIAGLIGGKYFERLLTRFSVPEELFGPLSMRGLENDEYVRQIAGYLPTAEVAFIDEIFKANSAILNALLTLLNERLFDNGNARFEVPLLCLVGASNELPESEELDALYDRFLFRRQVAQVSASQLATLAKLAAGAIPATNGSSGSTNATKEEELTMDDFRATSSAAMSNVEVPDDVVDILTGVRNWLQDKCEPPVYVSDRRFMKAVRMLQVAAYADGRESVNEYDCLLLEFVLGQRPDDAQKVKTFVLEIIASDPGLQQTELVFLGLFGRACRLLEEKNSSGGEMEEAKAEAQSLVELLELRQAGLASTLGDGSGIGGFPEMRTTAWQSESAVQAAVQSLMPQMTENKKRVEDLLKEALTLKEAMDRGVAAGVLERLLPKRYKQYQKGVTGKV